MWIEAVLSTGSRKCCHLISMPCHTPVLAIAICTNRAHISPRPVLPLWRDPLSLFLEHTHIHHVSSLRVCLHVFLSKEILWKESSASFKCICQNTRSTSLPCRDRIARCSPANCYEPHCFGCVFADWCRMRFSFSRWGSLTFGSGVWKAWPFVVWVSGKYLLFNKIKRRKVLEAKRYAYMKSIQLECTKILEISSRFYEWPSN